MATHLVTLASFPSAIEAALARGILADAGIMARVADDSSASLWSGMLGGAKLLVDEADLDRADQLLEEALNQPLADSIESEREDDQQPQSDFADNLPDRSPSVGKPSWTCNHCGASVAVDAPRCWSCGASPQGVIDPYQIGSGASIDEASSQPQQPPPATEHVQEWVNQAFRAACFSPIVLPPLLNFYSAWLLLCAAAESGDLPRESNRRFYIAWAINLVVGTAAGLMWTLFLRDWWPFHPSEWTAF